jgi:glyceraldehyde-3-phosphate dehydrogenase (NADP+)
VPQALGPRYDGTIMSDAPQTPERRSPTPLYLAGRWVTSSDILEVVDPAHPDQPAGSTYLADAAQVEEAIAASLRGFETMRSLPAYERSRALRAIAAGIDARRDEIAEIITRESGKPIRDARVEAERGALTFRLAAEEAERLLGETIPLDVGPAHVGRLGVTRRFPVGPVAAISPFNFPLNLAAHKLAPAIAAGCSVVLKPPTATPLTMLTVAEIVAETGLPGEALSVLPMSRQLGEQLVTDDRFKLLSFTGSPAVGWRMKERAGRKKVVLELGGNAGVIVDASADLDWAVRRVRMGAFAFSGQVCISVQRLYVHAAVWQPFMERFVAASSELRMGDPLDAATDLGPMIEPAAAQRTERWIGEAVADGARVLLGGTADGAWFPPTVIVDAPASSRICSEEAFAPVVVAVPFEDMESALQEVNASRFGLQAGIFTNDLQHAWRAFEALDVGGVILNDVPTYRVDHMPYGGVKDSGIGREGVRFAIEDMTELRLLVVARPG